MILLCGIPSERPLAMVRKRLVHAGAPFVEFNQRELDEIQMEYDISNGEITGWLKLGCRRYGLGEIRSVYTRLMNYHWLPEIEETAQDSPRRHAAARLHDAFVRWCEIAPARVVNRIRPSSSNSSKVYQSQIIRECDFEVPDTLMTNDPDEARAFVEEKKKVIFKSISGARSIVTLVSEDHLRLLDRIGNCPTMFQEFVEGTNVRVHVVGDEVFATRVESTAVDYRYATSQTGVPAELTAITLPDDVAEHCVALNNRLELGFSGIDLMTTPDGRTYCLEVNPCPGYSYYELNTGQPISEALARYLAQG